MPVLDSGSASKPTQVRLLSPSTASAEIIRSSVPVVQSGVGAIYPPHHRATVTESTPSSIHSPTFDSEYRQLEGKEWVSEFGSEPYSVLRPIPVDIRPCDPEGFEASFAKANISWVDDTRLEALNGLKAQILNTLDDYEENENQLGPEPRRQLDLLRSYIRRDP